MNKNLTKYHRQTHEDIGLAIDSIYYILYTMYYILLY